MKTKYVCLVKLFKHLSTYFYILQFTLLTQKIPPSPEKTEFSLFTPNIFYILSEKCFNYLYQTGLQLLIGVHVILFMYVCLLYK